MSAQAHKGNDIRSCVWKMYEGKDVSMDAWMDGCVDACMDGWMHGWMNGLVYVCFQGAAAHIFRDAPGSVHSQE